MEWALASDSMVASAVWIGFGNFLCDLNFDDSATTADRAQRRAMVDAIAPATQKAAH